RPMLEPRDPHDLLRLRAEAKLGRSEETIDHVVSSAHAVIDELGLALGSEQEQRGCFAPRNPGSELDIGLPPVVERAQRTPCRRVARDSIVEVECLARETTG